jgi:DNA-directed RNA polymerase subunit RPC12/RpoP
MIDIFSMIWLFGIALPLMIAIIYIFIAHKFNKKESENLYSFKCSSCGGMDVINANKNKTCKYCGTYHIIQKIKKEDSK